MASIITTNTIVLAEPVLDEKGKPVRMTTTYKGRQTEANASDSVHYEAGTVLQVSDALAKELIAAGAARVYDNDEAALG